MPNSVVGIFLSIASSLECGHLSNLRYSVNVVIISDNQIELKNIIKQFDENSN